MKPVKIFVASPNDALPERKTTSRVVERLQAEYQSLNIELYRYEDGHFFSAHDNYQAQIPDTTGFDIVVGIFWSHVGSPVPADYPKLPDGRAYPSHTAFELLTAIQAREAGKDLPDVLVYRKQKELSVPVNDAAARQQRDEQLNQLTDFVSEWFENKDEGVIRVSQPFEDTEDFAQKLEHDLRAWLRERRQPRTERKWRIEDDGSPFCGLSAFDGAHSRVFFGRHADIDRALDLLEDAQTAGFPFLLIEGPSGCGKSSLAKAGIIPRLQRRDPNLRSAELRPNDETDPFLSLATSLVQNGALPELLEGDFETEQEIADIFRAKRLEPIRKALRRAGESDQHGVNPDNANPVRVVLLVDQFESLLDQSFSNETQTLFALFIMSLVRSGAFTVIATVRPAARATMVSMEGLARLVDGRTMLTLRPLGIDNLSDIIRKPAEAAGIAFERDGNGRGLDEVILEDSRQGNALPLLQYTLAQLFALSFERFANDRRHPDEFEANEPILTFTHADYVAIGGIDGALAKQSEKAFAAVSKAAKDSLRELLRALTGLSREAAADSMNLVLRPARIDNLSSSANELAFALLERRIITTFDSKGDTIGFAHERVLTAWPRAKEALEAESTFLRVRNEIQMAEERWRRAGRPASLLLTGPPLAEALQLLKKYPGESDLQPDFIKQSSRRADLGKILISGIAAVFALLAFLAVFQAERAEQRRDNALIAQSRFIADQARQQREMGDHGTALLLALEALPSNLENPERPVVDEALWELDQAARGLREELTFRVPYAADDTAAAARSAATSLNTAELHPDGETVLASSLDGKVHRWDIQTGDYLKAIDSFAGGEISQLALSHDGKTLAIAGRLDGRARVSFVDMSSGTEIRAIAPVSFFDRSFLPAIPWVNFSPDGKLITIAITTERVQVWPVPTDDRPISQFASLRLEGEQYMHGTYWLDEGKKLALIGRLGEVKLVSFDEEGVRKEEVFELDLDGHDQGRGDNEDVVAVDNSGEPGTLYILSSRGDLFSLTFEGPNFVANICRDSDSCDFSGGRFSAERKLFLLSDADGSFIGFWDDGYGYLAFGRAGIYSFDRGESDIFSSTAVFHPIDGDAWVAFRDDGQISMHARDVFEVWRSGAFDNPPDAQELGNTSLSFTHDGDHIVSLHRLSLKRWDVAAPVRNIESPSAIAEEPNSLVSDMDAEELWDEQAQLPYAGDGCPYLEAMYPTYEGTSLRYDRELICIYEDGSVVVWDMNKGRVITEASVKKLLQSEAAQNDGNNSLIYLPSTDGRYVWSLLNTDVEDLYFFSLQNEKTWAVFLSDTHPPIMSEPRWSGERCLIDFDAYSRLNYQGRASPDIPLHWAGPNCQEGDIFPLHTIIDDFLKKLSSNQLIRWDSVDSNFYFDEGDTGKLLYSLYIFPNRAVHTVVDLNQRSLALQWQFNNVPSDPNYRGITIFESDNLIIERGRQIIRARDFGTGEILTEFRPWQPGWISLSNEGRSLIVETRFSKQEFPLWHDRAELLEYAQKRKPRELTSEQRQRFFLEEQ